MAVDLSILNGLWTSNPKEPDPKADAPKEPKTPKADQITEPEGEKTKKAAEQPERPAQIEGPEDPKKVFSFTAKQEQYIERTKKEILEQLYTCDDTPIILDKCLSLIAVTLNDRQYLSEARRIMYNVWGLGLKRIGSLDALPPEFALGEIERNRETLRKNLKGTEPGAQADIEKAISKMTEKGKGIYKKLPEVSKLNFEGF